MGPGSALSHRDGGELAGLRVRGRAGAVDVTTRRGRADQPGIAAHRVRRLDPADVTAIRGIPVTTVARTLVDLADVLGTRELRTVVHEAEVAGLLDLPASTPPSSGRRAGTRVPSGPRWPATARGPSSRSSTGSSGSRGARACPNLVATW